MTDREQLAEMIHKAELLMWGKPVGDAKSQREFIADYLLDHGAIVPPCKVGSTVYRIIEMGTGIHYRQVGRYEVGCTSGYKIAPCEETIKRFVRPVRVTKNNFFDICENIGKTVFLTREEAEAELERRTKQ